MVALTAEMKELFSKVKLFPVGTASKKGIPNVVPIANVVIENDDTIWLADNFMQKTLANLKENPHAAIYLYDSESKKCLQVKGKIEVKTSGEEYEKMKKRVHEKTRSSGKIPAFVMKITEVFDCMYGPAAGKTIL